MYDKESRKPPPINGFGKKKIRKCLKCQARFVSKHNGNRLCSRCNDDNLYLSKMSRCRGEAMVGVMPLQKGKGNGEKST